MPETLSETVPTECEQVALRMWDYLDDQLDRESTTTLRAHIAVCPQCYEYFMFQERFLEAVSSLRSSRSAPWPLKARILASLVAEGLAAH